MKHTALILLTAALLAVLLPLCSARFFREDSSGVQIANLSDEAAAAPSPSAEPAAASAEAAAAPSASPFPACDSSLTIRVLTSDGIQTMDMHNYLIGVVAAEMPATFQPEALKAQAVAARTYTLYKMYVSPSSSHPDADVCTDVTCCKAYKSVSELQEKWGGEYSKYMDKITRAVTDTDGVCIMYQDQPILAAFHSSSAYMTEDSKNVWGASLPYLVPVRSPETGEEVKNYTVSVEMTAQEFMTAIWEALEAEGPVPSLEQDSMIVEYTASGRISHLTVGGAVISGTALRALFDLRSAAIDIDLQDDVVTLTTTGYGHGVGMSQYGANAMATGGSTYEEILLWYYSGAVLGSVQTFRDTTV